MDNILLQYKNLLETVDHWFDRCIKLTATEIKCQRGCSSCCRGLFEISLLDAALLQKGFSSLDATCRQRILEKSRARLKDLQQQWPELQEPFILNRLPHEEWLEMPEGDLTPCPLLSDAGTCLVYDFRPMTCRLHGLPNIDLSGKSFSDEYCSLNFRNTDPLEIKELRWDFKRTFEQEFNLLGNFSEKLTGRRQLELDTFIPTALLIDFNRTDWPQKFHGENDRAT